MAMPLFTYILLMCLYQFASCSSDPEVYMSTIEIIQYWKYPAEVHKVTTADGYILELHRIPYGRNDSASNSSRPVIYMQHGLLGASDQFVDNPPAESPGFLFADAGFDVWLGNMRGNTYSRSHVNLTADDDEFWEFSWNEMSKFDLPATVDYILATTGQASLHYMGHSQGTAVMFARLSEDQDGSFGAKIKNFFALAPFGTVKYLKGLLRIGFELSPGLELYQSLFGAGEFLPSSTALKYFGDLVCGKLSITETLCSNVLFLVSGPNDNHFNKSRVDVYVGHSPAGTSTRNFIHWAQLSKSGVVAKYDFGMAGNLKAYGQITPPRYNYSQITYPNIYLYWGGNDWLATPQDIQGFLLKTLSPNVIKQNNYFDVYTHLDFIWGTTSPADIFNPIINLIRSA